MAFGESASRVTISVKTQAAYQSVPTSVKRSSHRFAPNDQSVFSIIPLAPHHAHPYAISMVANPIVRKIRIASLIGMAAGWCMLTSLEAQHNPMAGPVAYVPIVSAGVLISTFLGRIVRA